MLPCLVKCRSHLRRTSPSRYSDENLAFRPDFRAFFSSATHSSKFRTLFQLPYPVTPLLATLKKTAGVWPNSSHFGTRPSRDPSPFLSPQLSPAVRPSLYPLSHYPQFAIPFLFRFLRTLLHLPKSQLLYFQALAHSLRKTTRGGGTPAVTEAQNDLHHRQHEPVPQPAALLSSTGHGSQDTVHASPGCRLLRRMLRFGVP